jgi:hypothetical protein
MLVVNKFIIDTTINIHTLQTKGGYHKYDIVFTIKSLPSTNSTHCLLNKNAQNRIKNTWC